MRTALLLVTLSALGAFASTIVPHTLQQRAQASDRVALVKVVAQAVEGDDRNLKTLVDVDVQQDVRGQGPRRIRIVQIGGARNGYEIHVPGDASFDLGETALVFLRCDAAGARCGLVALGEGKLQLNGDFTIVHDLFSGAYLRRPLAEVLAELRAVPPSVVLPPRGSGTAAKGATP